MNGIPVRLRSEDPLADIQRIAAENPEGGKFVRDRLEIDRPEGLVDSCLHMVKQSSDCHRLAVWRPVKGRLNPDSDTADHLNRDTRAYFIFHICMRNVSRSGSIILYKICNVGCKAGQ